MQEKEWKGKEKRWKKRGGEGGKGVRGRNKGYNRPSIQWIRGFRGFEEGKR